MNIANETTPLLATPPVPIVHPPGRNAHFFVNHFIATSDHSLPYQKNLLTQSTTLSYEHPNSLLIEGEHHPSSFKESCIRVEQPSLEELEPLLPRSPSSTYGTFPSINATSNAAENFSRPKEWDRSSIIDAQHFYQEQFQHTADPKLRERYRQLSLLLTTMLKSQDALHNATREKSGDARSAYRDAFFKYKAATQAFLNGNDLAASFFNKHATELMHAASDFEKVVSLAKPHELTGPLRLKIANTNTATRQVEELNLSEFSFEQQGAITQYYLMIDSSDIVGGSNIQTIQEQKKLINDAEQHLAKANEYAIQGFPFSGL